MSANLYSEWRDFYLKRVSSWMSLEELRAECGKLQTVDNPSPEVLLVHAMHALEECVKRDEALLRQALEALSRAHQTAMEQTLKARIPECAEFAGIAQDLDFVVAALRERLGENGPGQLLGCAGSALDRRAHQGRRADRARKEGSMTDITQDLAALDAALENWPTHGPWHATKQESHGAGVRGPAGVSLAWCGCATAVGEEVCYSISASEAAANAHFVAACSPDRIRRLLKAVKERDEEIERLQEVSDEMFAAMTAAMLLVPHSSGAYGVLNEAIKSHSQDAKAQAQVQEKGWVIGYIQDGPIELSDFPKVYETEESVNAGIEQLAVAHKGITFVKLKIENFVTSAGM